jgi:hypothetical protein
MPRIYRFKCTVCQRSVERFAQGDRINPVRCVITANCNGLLTLTSDHYGARLTPTPYVPGLEDRPVRGSVMNEITSATITQIPITSAPSLALTLLACTTSYQIVDLNGIARTVGVIPGQPLDVTVELVLRELSSASLAYTRFIFQRKQEVIKIVGRDDSASQGTLMIPIGHNIQIFVNGTVQDPSTYTYTTTDVSFITPIIGATITLEIFVSQPPATVGDELILAFNGLDVNDAARLGLAWGDTASADNMYPLFCTDMSMLNITKAYQVVRAQGIDIFGGKFSFIQGEILLSYAPHSFTDVNRTQQLNLSSLLSLPLTFNPDTITGLMSLTVNDIAINNRVRPILIEPLGLTSVVTSQLVSHKATSYILGPT